MLPGEIKIPIGTATLFYQDYFHRKNTVSCEIAMSLRAEQNNLDILFCTRYFDTMGNNRRDKNLRSQNKFSLKENKTFLVPDMVFRTSEVTGAKESLYTLEMYNGKNTLRTLEQLKKHIEAIEI